MGGCDVQKVPEKEGGQMKKPIEFVEWCASIGIPRRSHDESVAWAAWLKCYELIIERIKNDRQTTSKSHK